MNLPPLPDHWMTASLLGANGSFQRAAREYAEEYARAYAEAAALAMRERIAAWLDEQHQKRKHLDNHAAFYATAIRALE